MSECVASNIAEKLLEVANAKGRKAENKEALLQLAQLFEDMSKANKVQSSASLENSFSGIYGAPGQRTAGDSTTVKEGTTATSKTEERRRTNILELHKGYIVLSDSELKDLTPMATQSTINSKEDLWALFEDLVTLHENTTGVQLTQKEDIREQLSNALINLDVVKGMKVSTAPIAMHYMSWNSSTRTLSIPNSLDILTTKGNPIQAIVHEYVHAITMEACKDETDPAVKQLNNLYDRVKKHFQQKGEYTGKQLGHSVFYGLKDKYEFVAEAISNKEFQEKLNEVRGEHLPADIVARIKQIYLRFVKKVTGKEYTALDEALDLISALTNKPVVALNPKGSTENNITERHPNHYILSNGHEANEQQKVAMDKIEEWWDSDQHTFILNGRGGTGKTAIVSKAIQNLGLSADEVVILAPSHNALEVVHKSANGTSMSGADYNTTASILGKKKGIGGYSKASETNKLQGKALIVVDEVSMVGIDDYIALVNLANKNKAKVLFMGDRLQLPPIYSEKMKKAYKDRVLDESPAFTDAQDSAELTKVMRQKEGSPIAKFTDIVYQLGADALNSAEGNKWYNAVNGIKSWIRKVGRSHTSYTNGEGIVVANMFSGIVMENLLRDFKNNPQDTKVIHYNRAVHETTVELTSKIRQERFRNGDLGSVEGKTPEQMDREFPFVVGDPLVGGESMVILDEVGSSTDSVANVSKLMNGQSAVIAGDITTTNVNAMKGKTLKGKTLQSISGGVVVDEVTATWEELTQPYKGIKLEVVDGDTITSMDIRRVMPNGTSMTTKINVPNIRLSGAIEEFKKNLKGIYWKSDDATKDEIAKRVDMLDALLPDVSTGYVINSHKAQGSSYQNVYVDVDNILNSNASPREKLELLYVAASRPKSKLVLVSRGNKDYNSDLLKTEAAGADKVILTNECGK